jgi:hypothetical protein
MCSRARRRDRRATATRSWSPVPPRRRCPRTGVCGAQAEPAALVEADHVEYAVHPDRRARRQPSDQSVAPLVPQRCAQAAAAEVAPNDEEAHEAEPATVRDDRATPHETVPPPERDEAVRVVVPGDPEIGEAGIPALVLCPVEQGRRLAGDHRTDLVTGGEPVRHVSRQVAAVRIDAAKASASSAVIGRPEGEIQSSRNSPRSSSQWAAAGVSAACSMPAGAGLAYA